MTTDDAREEGVEAEPVGVERHAVDVGAIRPLLVGRT